MFKGNQAYQQGRFDDAEVFYKTALKESPNLWPLHYNLGNTYYKEERYAEACEAYRQGLPNYADVLKTNALANLGNARYMQGRLEPALQAYKKAMLLSNGSPTIRRNYLFLLRQIERAKLRRPAGKKNNVAEKDKPDNKGDGGKKEDTPENKDNKGYQLSENNLTELFKKIERDEDAARNRLSKTKRKNKKPPVDDGPDY